jgi:hypothetical protein
MIAATWTHGLQDPWRIILQTEVLGSEAPLRALGWQIGRESSEFAVADSTRHGRFCSRQQLSLGFDQSAADATGLEGELHIPGNIPFPSSDANGVMQLLQSLAHLSNAMLLSNGIRIHASLGLNR